MPLSLCSVILSFFGKEEKNGLQADCLSFYLSISYANWLNDSNCDKNRSLVRRDSRDMEIETERKKKNKTHQLTSKLSTVGYSDNGFHFDIVRLWLFFVHFLVSSLLFLSVVLCCWSPHHTTNPKIIMRFLSIRKQSVRMCVSFLLFLSHFYFVLSKR